MTDWIPCPSCKSRDRATVGLTLLAGVMGVLPSDEPMFVTANGRRHLMEWTNTRVTSLICFGLRCRACGHLQVLRAIDPAEAALLRREPWVQVGDELHPWLATDGWSEGPAAIPDGPGLKVVPFTDLSLAEGVSLADLSKDEQDRLDPAVALSDLLDLHDDSIAQEVVVATALGDRVVAE